MLEILATIAGVTMCASAFLQTHKIVKRKSSADISIPMYKVWFVGSIIWVAYGVEIKSIPLIITNIVALLGYISVIAVSRKYK